MKFIARTISILAFLTAFLILSPPPIAQAVSCTWDGTNGNWTEEEKWDCDQVPGPDDEAFISSGTVNLTASTRVKSLTLSGGTLTGEGNLTAETITWSAGTMSGSGSTTATTEAEFTGSNYLTLNGRTFNNAGAATYTRSGVGYLYLYTAETVFNNLAGATFTIESSGVKAVGGPGTFNNEGRFIKSSFDDTVQIGTIFVNTSTGVIEVESGTLIISNSAATTNSGGYRVLSDATLRLAGVRQSLTGDIVGTGEGTIEVVIPVDLDGTLTILDGVLSLPSNGALNLSTGAATADVGTFNLSGGNLTGPGELTADTINWSAGTMSGRGSTTATTALNFTGYAILTLNSRTLNNTGSATWNRTGSGYLHLQTTETVFNNLASANFTIQSSGLNFVLGSGTFNNAGTLTKSSSGNTVQISAAFVNAGTGIVEVESGTLVISNGAGASSGDYHVLSGAALRLIGNPHNLTGNITGMGQGTIEAAATVNLDGTLSFPGALTLVSGGTLNLSTDATTADVGTLNLSLGVLTGPGDLTAGTINWSAGTMSGSGSTTASSAANFTGTGNITLNGRTFNNAGAATWNRTGAGFLNFQTAASVFNNQAGATFTVQSSGPDITYGNGVFNNAGTLNLTTGKFSIHTFRQSPGGITNLAVGGETPFTDYCRLVTTQADLVGELSVTFTSGYTPQIGDRYVLLTYSTRTGDYSSVRVAPVADIIWTWYYQGNALHLWAAKCRSNIPLVMR